MFGRGGPVLRPIGRLISRRIRRYGPEFAQIDFQRREFGVIWFAGSGNLRAAGRVVSDFRALTASGTA